MKPFIAVAISGGVDSLVAANLLKEQGIEVIGLHFITGFESFSSTEKPSLENTSTESLRTEAEKKLNPISKQLDIPVIVLDLQEEFKRCVVDNFIETYRSGKTPNPCLVCNPSIKFGTLLKYALKMGATQLATGHYAGIKKDPDGSVHLSMGVDRIKDQSYFLGFMNQYQLSRACFPLGGMTKSMVRKIAHKNALVPLTRTESQDVCFIKGFSYGEFLARYLTSEPGLIEDTSGKVIGEHKGLHLFTIGQRRGINCPASEPYYVVQIDIKKNCLIVGYKHELYCRECHVEAINWIKDIPSSSMTVRTRVRYRHDAAVSEIIPLNDHTARVCFEKPQKAVTPGQGAVFYLDDEVIGAGWIA
ncbi:MAG: tRNA 2-thiouridine(34) synthase MnmA [Desulfobacterales bacterium]